MPVARPMAIHGVICKKDGSVVQVCVGEDEKDPIVEISDLLEMTGRERYRRLLERYTRNRLFDELLAGRDLEDVLLLHE